MPRYKYWFAFPLYDVCVMLLFMLDLRDVSSRHRHYSSNLIYFLSPDLLRDILFIFKCILNGYFFLGRVIINVFLRSQDVPARMCLCLMLHLIVFCFLQMNKLYNCDSNQSDKNVTFFFVMTASQSTV